MVAAEASSIASLWRDVEGYPPSLRDELQETLRGYTHQVIHEAWPLLRKGEIPREGVEWMDRFQKTLYAYEPASDSRRILHADTIRAFQALIQHRRQRLDVAQAQLPVVMWWVLLPGAMGGLVLCYFFHLDRMRVQALFLTGLAMFLAMVLWVIFALDRPLSGDMRVSADSYILVYEHHMVPAERPKP